MLYRLLIAAMIAAAGTYVSTFVHSLIFIYPAIYVG